MGELRKDRRRYLTQDELARLISAAKQGRYGQRDATGLAYLRCAELINSVTTAEDDTTISRLA